MTILRFHYEGNTPSKKNQKQIFRGKNGKPFISASSDFKDWHKKAEWEIKLQMSRQTSARFPVQRCVRVYANLFYDTNRARDNSNTWESILDLMVDVGILSDDSWQVTGPTAQFPKYRKGEPGWVLFIETADAAPGPAEVHNAVMPTAAGARV